MEAVCVCLDLQILFILLTKEGKRQISFEELSNAVMCPKNFVNKSLSKLLTLGVVNKVGNSISLTTYDVKLVRRLISILRGT